MTNKELQQLLAKLPDDAYVYYYEGNNDWDGKIYGLGNPQVSYASEVDDDSDWESLDKETYADIKHILI